MSRYQSRSRSPFNSHSRGYYEDPQRTTGNRQPPGNTTQQPPRYTDNFNISQPYGGGIDTNGTAPSVNPTLLAQSLQAGAEILHPGISAHEYLENTHTNTITVPNSEFADLYQQTNHLHPSKTITAQDILLHGIHYSLLFPGWGNHLERIILQILSTNCLKYNPENHPPTFSKPFPFPQTQIYTRLVHPSQTKTSLYLNRRLLPHQKNSHL